MKNYNNLEDDRKILLDAVSKAGQVALGYYGKTKAEWKQDGTPVSEADYKVDQFLKDTLLGARPSYGWLSEESEEDHTRLKCDLTWVIDPIDGTRSFVNHRPEWSIAAALIHNGQPVLAVVYNPVTGELFEAIRGKGARLNNEVISVSKNSDNPFAIMLSKNFLSTLEACTYLPFKKVSYINSIAYRICLLAKGDYDVMISKSGCHDWDIIGAHLILAEAGGEMTSTAAQNLHYNQETIKHPMLLATNKLAHNKLLKLCEDIKF